MGYQIPLNEKNTLDVSTKYLWGRLSGANKMIAGDPIKFKAINSNRMRLNMNWKHQYNQNTQLFAGIGYEYNFSSKAKATTHKIYNINAPDLKGSTGILSFGATIQPTQNKNFSLEFSAEGYIGKRQGGKGNITFKYAI